MEWLKNNAVVVFIIIGLITYIEVRLSDLKADLKADNRELREELTTDIRELRTELKGDIKEIRSLLVTYILKNNDGSTGPLALNSKKSGLKPQKTAKSENKPATPQKTAKALPDKPIKPTKPTAKKIQKTGFLKGAALEDSPT